MAGRGRFRLIVAVISALMVLAAGCSSGSSLGGSGSADNASAGAESTDPTGGATEEAVRTYGYGPITAPGVVYAPDVVMVPRGPAAVLDASSDGLTWTLDRSAPGVDTLKVGSVLVATARATGRVAAIRNEGSTRVVTLAPVEITDIVRDGTITFRQSVDEDSVWLQEVPDQPGGQLLPLEDGPIADEVGDSGDVPTTTVIARNRGVDRPIGLASVDGRGLFAALPPPSKGSVTIPAGDYRITPGFKGRELSLDIKRAGSLQLGVKLTFAVSELTVDSSVSIANGVIGGTTVLLGGITGMKVDVAAGAGKGVGDNEKIRLELPAEFSFAVPPSPGTAGLPMVFKFSFAFSIATAFSGNNSTVVATGVYGLDGPIGIRGGEVVAPTLSVKQSILDSFSGLAIGPSGLTVAVKLTVRAGIGITVASAGPYVSFTTSLGLTDGSALGSPLARCKGATLDYFIGGGANIAISGPVIDQLKKLLPPGVSIPEIAERKVNVLHREQVVPDVPLCRGG